MRWGLLLAMVTGLFVGCIIAFRELPLVGAGIFGGSAAVGFLGLKYRLHMKALHGS